MAGVSHTILMRAKAPEPLATAPSIFTIRGARALSTPPGGSCTPVPIWISSAPGEHIRRDRPAARAAAARKLGKGQGAQAPSRG